VSRGARPDFDSHALYIHYMIMLRAAAAASTPDEDFAEAQARAQGVDWRTRDVGLANAYGLSLSHRDWLRLNEQRLGVAAKWAAFFENHDVLLCPVLATAAFPHTDAPPQGRTLTVNGHEVPFENQLFWAGYAGLPHLPASVAPIGQTPEGLPIGVQIIGPRLGDLTTLRFAQLLEQRYRAFQPPPGC
jgi:amidase